MKILLTTLHAKYSHASLALPSLAACCQDVPGVSLTIKELTINEPHGQLLRQIVAAQADLIGFSCSIWNIEQTLHLISDIKKITPETIIVTGGPEVSFGIFELMHLNSGIDYVIKGEGERAFKKLLLAVIESTFDNLHEIHNLYYREGDDIVCGAEECGSLELDQLPSPFQVGLINFDKPLTYYETSRGCPFSCAFCLSSTDQHVRSYSMGRIKQDLLFLMERKTLTIKLVDRTFNYDADRAHQIWQFILQHNRESRFHFEIAADLLNNDNLELLRQVPPDCFHFEIGIQSASQETLRSVSRKSDLQRAYAAIRRMRSETTVELHLDLVAGLPGEDYGQFLESLQVLLDLAPHQIQVEPLKVLKGARMRKIAAQDQYAYSDFPPYMILRNPWLTYEDICRIETVGKLLDLFYNQGKFKTVLTWLKRKWQISTLFDAMAGNADTASLHGLSTQRAFELLHTLVAPILDQHDLPLFEDLLFYDYCHIEMPRAGKLPAFIASRCDQCAWPGGGRKVFSADISIPEGARVTLFSFIFLRDHRQESLQADPLELRFAYISRAGCGQTVMKV